MSNINYDVWGEPSDWSEWSDSPISNAIWGNQRLGASNFNNADFTNYPQFKLGGTNQSLRTKINAGDISLNTPLDNSIAYTAIANNDLPQLNVALFGKGHTTVNNPFTYRDNSKPIPFAFAYLNDLNDTNFNQSRYQQILGFDGFPNNATVIGQQSLQRWSPYATMNVASTTTPYEYNQEGQIMPVLSFGIKSVIFEIIAVYVDTGDTTAKTNLKGYLNHTDEWLQAHKLVGAYLKPYYRVNVNGEYSSTVPGGVSAKDRANGIQPIFFTPYKLGDIDIYNYSSQWSRVSGCLPIYGNCIVDSWYAYRYVNSYLENNPDNDSCSYWAMIYGYNRGNLHVEESGNGASTYITLDMSKAENVEYIMRGAAAYGLFFCKAIGHLGDSGRDTGETERWLDTNMYCGVITDTGLTFGDYTHGENNAENSVYGWIDSTQTPYDPDSNPDPNHYSDTTNLPDLADGSVGWWTDKTYGTTTPRMNIDNLISAITNLADNPYNQDFIFQEPLKAVLDYRRILMSQPFYRAVSSTPIPLGRFTAPSESAFVGFEGFGRQRRETIGSFKFWRTFGNFLDFEPYSQAILYFPYCGTKQLPMNIFAGHTVNIYLNADNCTGELRVLIFVDDIEWGTMSGMASEELPLISETSMTAANTIRSLQYQDNQLEWSKITTLTGASTGAMISATHRNPGGVVPQILGGIFKAYQYSDQQDEINYQIAHTKPEPLTIQKGSPNLDKINVLYPFIMLQSPKFINAETDEEIQALKENFGKTKGFKCCLVGNLGDFHGLTKCSTAVLDGISCTYTEKKMILQALQEGVIL